ncbi:TolC family protein [Aureibaculum sp. A20]|uniref:TolC family protein n=1 Tax=Aureibaculum flavum TaxID=2795986 RepID=A0ABS0WTQ6_9FLAO|nr:TolC family protein [Aureibaculum flavum]MBJ2175343.1 TolC family protein [Aureibaculum flavum]
MKKILILLLVIFPCITFGQSKTITLNEAIKIARQKSPDYKTNLNKNQASYWRFKNYRASFLPQLELSATLPEFSNYTRRLTNDQGEDIFVNQNQSRIEGNLSLSQNIPFTGGTLSVGSSLERVDIYGNNENTGYSVVPFSLSYFQSSIFYNPFKWNKKIEPLIYEESKRDFVENMEQISLNTCSRYFALLNAQTQLDIAEKNLSNQDTLFQIAKGRFRMGKIAENDLLQMELALLNSKNKLTTVSISLKKASQDFARYLELDSETIQLEIPSKLSLFTVDVEKAMAEAQNNRKAVIEFRRRRLESEKELARVKGSNKLTLGLNANFGISQQGDVFDELYQNYNKQQYFSLSVGLPIFDWGVSKSQRKMAEANLDLLNNNIEQEKQAFEQEIYLHTLNWSNQREFLLTSEKAQEIGNKRYDITKKRYILGKISITDLNLAQEEKDKAAVQYLNSLQKFWVDYYTLRKLTLYDFINDKKITSDDIFNE